MIISHLHKFIFVKTRKTAGTSVELALSEHCGPDDVITAFEDPKDEILRAELGYPGPQNTDIALTRKPFRSIGSVVFNRRRRQFFEHMSASHIRNSIGVDIWRSYFKFSLERNPFDTAASLYFYKTAELGLQQSINEFLGAQSNYVLSNWHVYADGNEILVDFVARQERLARDLDLISNRLGFEIRLPPRRAKGNFRTDGRHYSDLLSPLVRSRIEQACWRQMSTFSYSWIDRADRSTPGVGTNG